MFAVNICFKSVQGQDELLEHRSGRCNADNVQLKIIINSGDVKSGMDILIFPVQEEVNLQSKRYVFFWSAVWKFIENLGFQASALWDDFNKEETFKIIPNFPTVLLDITNKTDLLVIVMDVKIVTLTRQTTLALVMQTRFHKAQEFLTFTK